MRSLAVALALMLVGCASTAPSAPPVAAPPQPDPRIAELETSMTELLERIDVLNERMARLEDAMATTTAAPPTIAIPPAAETSSPEPASVAPEASPGETVPSVPETGSAPEAVSAPEAPPAPAATPAPESATRQDALAGADLADAYRRAMTLFQKKRYPEARRAFQEIFESDPVGGLADNALFWIGETYAASGDQTNALRYYARVVRDFPEESKAPDALFKSALAIEHTGDLALARKTLQQVIDRYPYSSSAAAAKKELERIRY